MTQIFKDKGKHVLPVFLLSILLLISFSYGAETSVLDDVSFQNNNIARVDSEKVDSTWKTVHLSFYSEDSVLSNVKFLRPLWWLEYNDVVVGEKFFLEIAELGIKDSVNVDSISGCVPDSISQRSTGQYVTGTMVKDGYTVLDLYFNGESELSVGATELHPFWSATRNEWVEVKDLKIGEYVKTSKGILQLSQIVMRDGTFTAYNLEVQKEHTYFVSEEAILVHNNCTDTPYNNPSKFTSQKIEGNRVFVHNENGCVMMKNTAQHGGNSYNVWNSVKSFKKAAKTKMARDYSVWAESGKSRGR